MKPFLILLAVLVVAVIVVFGLRGHRFTRPPFEIVPDMDHQPKVLAQTPSNFFADGRAAREPVPGTIPLGHTMPQTRTDLPPVSAYYETGQMGDHWGSGFPLTVTAETMRRGQERFNITCAACHGATGSGNGMAFKFGLVTVQNLNQPRLREMAEGEIFHTITHGKNTMLGLGDRLSVADRWAVIAYLRALQKSQGGATVSDVPPDELAKLPLP